MLLSALCRSLRHEPIIREVHGDSVKGCVVQTAAVLVLEPIFEADLQPEQYAYRADRSALDAVKCVHKLINTGHQEIVDADLSSYFDTVPHAEMMKTLARRIVDGAMLHLIKMWLETPVEETDDHGNKHRTTRNRNEGRGTPQGAPVSPLLGNLYMRRFVLGWKRSRREQRWQAYIVNYADDLVICCREGAEQALAMMRRMMDKLKLTVNEAKTRICRLPEEKFDFLGYKFGRCYSPKTGRAYLGTVPAPKRIQRICGEVRATTARTRTSLDSVTIVAKLNVYTGWQKEHRATRSSWPLRTNWRGSPGSCCRAATNISTRRCWQRPEAGRGKDAALGKHKTLSTFPPQLQREIEKSSTEVC
jgi:RNA-directed DNA polymerase